MHSNSLAVDDSSTCVQLFVGTKTIVTDAYGMKTDKQFVNALENIILGNEELWKAHLG